MCRPDKIAALLITASILIIAATVLFVIGTGLASNWWASGANVVLVLSAAVAVGAALSAVGFTVVEATKCQFGRACQDFCVRGIA